MERPGSKLLSTEITRGDGDRVHDVLAGDSEREDGTDGTGAGEDQEPKKDGPNRCEPHAVDGRAGGLIDAVEVFGER